MRLTKVPILAAITVMLAAAAVLALRFDPGRDSVIRASAGAGDAETIGSATTVPSAHSDAGGDAPSLPIEGRLDQNLTCQGEMMASTSYDSLAGNGHARPEEALEVALGAYFPQAPRNFALTGRTQFKARFENDRGAFLVALLEDGLWHMDHSDVCASTGVEWTRGSAIDRRR